MAEPLISIVLPAYNEGPRLESTLASLRETVELPYEAIVVNDGSTDDCCRFLDARDAIFENVVLLELEERRGVAYARNLGAEHAKAPILIAMDAHCIARSSWLEGLLDELHKQEAGIVAPRISSLDCPSATAFGLTIRDRELGVEWLHREGDEPYSVPAVGCACMAMTREFFEELGRFDAMRSYGMEDVELCLRCWLAGRSVMMVPDAEVSHWFKKVPFAVGWRDYLYNRLRTATVHFDGEALRGILRTLQTKPEFGDAISSLLTSDIWERRSFVRERRKRDTDWFCQRFGIAL